MTAVAAAVVAVLFLTTGGTPLLFIGYGEISWDQGERTPLQRRIEGVQQSLDRVRARRENAELQTLLDDALRRTQVDPAVFRWVGHALVAEPAGAAVLRPLWNGLPSHRAEIRTVVILSADRPNWYRGDASIDSSGTCVIRRNGPDAMKDLTRAVRRMGGECLMAEQSGVPGKGMIVWRGGVRSGLAWEHSTADVANRWGGEDDESTAPAWFNRGSGSLWRDGDGWMYRPIGRAEMACLVGRSGQCEAATGVATEGWPSTGVRWGYSDQRLPIAILPRDLFVAASPDRFGQIWRSSDPIATSYRRVTGASMDDWLGDWARRYAGPVQRDNGLSLAGWVGAFLWLVLLGLLTFERLKQRSVT
ncbi:MAG TPA: hypothetical protein VF454_03820 [Gemmatimonadales bacterium]